MLQKQVGKWNVSMKTWQAPDQPPMESTGTAETKSLLGDRYIQTNINSTMMGKPFSGQGTTGYDNTKKKFVGTWIDSMSTGIMRAEGTTDPSGKVMTTQITGVDPVTGKESKMKIVGKWESDDKLVEEFYEKRAARKPRPWRSPTAGPSKPSCAQDRPDVRPDVRPDADCPDLGAVLYAQAPAAGK